MEQGDVLHTETVLLDFPLEVDQRPARKILEFPILVPLVEGEGQEYTPDHQHRLHQHAGNPGTPPKGAFGLRRTKVGQWALCWLAASQETDSREKDPAEENGRRWGVGPGSPR